MRTKVTKAWLEKQKPCVDGFEYWIEQKKVDLFDFIEQCIKDDHCDWANWLMVRCMDRKKYMRYALYAVKQSEPLYRKKYPGSTTVTDAIRVVKACIEADSKVNREAAKAVANVSYAAAAAANANAACASYVNAACANVAAYFYVTGNYAVAYTKMLRYGMRIMKEKQK